MQYLTVRIGRARRTYTYHHEGDPVAAGASVKLPDPKGSSFIRGTVVEPDVEKPAYATKPILGLAEDTPPPPDEAEPDPWTRVGEVEAPQPNIGHNRPPPFDQSAVDDLWKRARELADEAGRWAENGPIQDESTAERAGDTFNGLRKLSRETEDKRKADKEPHLSAGREVDAAYASIKSGIEMAGRNLRKLLDEWADRRAAEQRRLKAEAEAEARRQADEAEKQAAAAAARHDAIGEAEAEQKAKEAATAQKEAASTKTTGAIGSATGGGRTLSQRTYHEAEIENPRRAFLSLFDDYPADLTAELKRLAEAKMRHTPAAAKDALTIPGVKFHKRRTIQ